MHAFSRKQVDSSQFDEQLARTQQQIIKALEHLEVSIEKTRTLPVAIAQLTEQQLEAWESLCSRFSRTVDLFTAKWLRTKIAREEPGFRGSTRDLLNLAEKLNLIVSADKWFELKELRNKQAHDYEDSNLHALFTAIRTESPIILQQLRDFFAPNTGKA